MNDCVMFILGYIFGTFLFMVVYFLICYVGSEVEKYGLYGFLRRLWK